MTETASKASDTDFRKKWDKEEYTEKARKRDLEERERMQENEARMRKGKKPRKGPKIEGPKPTALMQQRDGSLDLDKDLNKTIVVQNPTGRGPGQPGFFCETCNQTYRDSTGYLDHINSRAHLRAIGQSTRIERSTIEQVRARIALLREKTQDAVTAKTYDFDKRLAEIKAKELALRQQKKAQKKEQREQVRLTLVQETTQDDEMAQMMGFSGFGSSKK